ncbi:unnamed protein product [Fraxinus pennsylvanica]|uniref:Small auxin up regulated protein n=1 Tax=Fraxinus pennsylvanica TaxID=56036 RepID=A0AAD2DKV2_9LAMI|nr:unnamed protein product [Fraxinus pennsylvanica]
MHRQEEKKMKLKKGQEEEEMKLKKGCVTVQVGLENGLFQRFVISISYLHDPLFQRLEFYDYDTTRPLMLPCSVEDFVHLQRHIEMGVTKHSHGQRHCHRTSTLSY